MTATPGQDISIRFGTSGENAVFAAINKVRSAANRVKAPLVDDLGNLTKVAGVMGKIGLAATGIAGAGLAGVAGSLAKAREIASGVAEELTSIRNAGRGMGVEMTQEMGAIAFAMGQVAGWEGIEEILGAGGAIMEQALEVKNFNEEVVASWKELGITYEDLFANSDIDENGQLTGTLRGIDEILIRISDRIGGLDDANILEKLIPLFGASDGAKIAAFLKADSAEFREQIQLYRDLTAYREADVEASVAYRKSLSANEAAMLGLRVAFTRELFPVLTESNSKFQEFAHKNQGRVEMLGLAFSDFVGDLEPLLLRAADLILAVAVGDGLPEDTPLTRTIAGLLDMIRAFKDGLVDVMEYLTTGQTDSPWLQNTMDFLADLKETISSIVSGIRDLYGVIADDVAPAISSLIGGIDDMMTALGVEDTGSQLAIVGALVLFSNTILSTIGLVGKLAAGLGTLAGAAISGVGAMGAAGAAAAGAGAAGSTAAGVAAGAATGAALVGGAAWVTMSTEDMRAEMEKAAETAKKLAAEHGEAYAAAYLRAFIAQVPDTKSGFSAANWLAEKLGFGADFEGAKAELDVIIKGGDASQAIAGAARAFENYGWAVDPSGQIEIGAGITVSGLEISASIQRQLDDLQAKLRIEAGADALAMRSTVPDIDMSAVTAAAAQAVGSGQPQNVFVIQFEDGTTVSTTDSDAIQRFSTARNISIRARS